ncbi:uncharacterized protein LOC129573410 [Sitodiplosis mosellana]|uniref:uncharacterized protein LOC129573410 n=1 Tax=Sitodiplosis mosellana TaxID=263140 RepID=UPI0024451E1C|nr:uncharacterized protein LOC129573410 [Sitodiplosis mosellana]
MASLKWKEEFDKMLVSLDRKTTLTLRLIEADFNSEGKALPEGFKEHFLGATSERIKRSYEQYEMSPRANVSRLNIAGSLNMDLDQATMENAINIIKIDVQTVDESENDEEEKVDEVHPNTMTRMMNQDIGGPDPGDPQSVRQQIEMIWPAATATAGNSQSVPTGTVQNAQNTVQPKQFKCQICDYVSRWKHCVTRHMRCIHQSRTCEICNKQVANAKLLKKHMKTHTTTINVSDQHQQRHYST